MNEKIEEVKLLLDQKAKEYDKKARFMLRYTHAIIVMAMIFFIYSFMVETNTFTFDLDGWKPQISIEQKPDMKKLDSSSVIISTNVSRLSILLFAALLVKNFLSIYKYNEKIKNFYRARYDALNMIGKYSDAKFLKLSAILSSDSIDFEKNAEQDLETSARTISTATKLMK